MAIQKKEYELSVWVETLNTSGTESVKEERKLGIIGAHDMSYNGRASLIKLQTKINGTHNLTFQMPDKWFDSEKGDFVRNEFLDLAQNERKVKLYYKNEWYEFFIKNVKMNKKYKSYMYDFTCTDAYIDELARNGYDIIFSTDLSNNVEEVGVFTEEIIDGSQWRYTPENNWGDFTEYSEERLFKIPVSQFTSISAHKLNYATSETDAIQNRYTKEKRTLELGDDLARAHEWYWDAQDSSKNISLLGGAATTLEGIGGYIYVPFSQLDFCYVTTGETGGNNILVSTEEPAFDENGKYYLAPASIDPTSLIEFIAIPEDAEVDIDESGLIVNKKYTYVMTVEEWNKAVKGTTWYFFEQYKDNSGDYKKEIVNSSSATAPIYGNKVVIYDGYLDSINDVEVVNGKKIVISDRTIKNISKDIDEYVKVYNKPSEDYTDLLTNPDGWVESDVSYKVCSDLQSRVVEPQLARNYIQNGTNIKSTDGWEIMATPDSSSSDTTPMVAAQLKMVMASDEQTESEPDDKTAYLEFTASKNTPSSTTIYDTIINFGAIGQEKIIKAGTIYCLGIQGIGLKKCHFTIGKGKIASDGNYQMSDSVVVDMKTLTDNEAKFVLVSFYNDIENPYIGLHLVGTEDTEDNFKCRIENCWFFEAYSKGKDFFPDIEQVSYAKYRYSGRELQIKLTDTSGCSLSEYYTQAQISKMVLFENDIMSGGIYGYRRYFIQQLKTTLKNDATKVYDTFGATKYTSENVTDVSTTLPLPASKYGEDDYEIITNYIDLGKCPHYKGNTEADEFDCTYGDASSRGVHICSYQKYGYCPYLFQTEKHCRRTRTLTGEKSNRFNLTQEVSKVFEVYPNYYIEHTPTGAVKYDDNGRPIKDIFYMTEKGKNSKVGFRYEKNLSNITKTVVSDQIVTKLYVQDSDSTLSKTGLCSIATAVDNPSKDRFIIDLSYYVKQGMLDKTQTEEDLYGSEHNENSFAFLKKLGYYNSMYDAISNKIINLTNQEYGGLESNLYVNLTGIETAQKEIAKIKKQMAKYTSKAASYTQENQTYQNYITKLREQQKTLIGLVNDTFYTNDVTYGDSYIAPLTFIDQHDITTIKNTWVGNSEYKSYGMIGQYNTRYEQVQNWKKERAKYLHDINALSEQFFKRYEPYLKEGTWSSSNYLTDDAYYHDALEVAAEGAIPKVTYDISVVPLNVFNEDYEFGVGDITWVEDIGMFDVNKKTGFPNRLKTLVSELNEDLDIPSQNTIKVQNFTTQFEDLFEQVTASVQSLTFNENIYKRASNFTATKNVKTDSLQGTLDTNELTLLDTAESNIKLDAEGQAGSDINNHNNKYKLNGQGLFFSNDAGEHWNIGVGPSGINADYIKTGTLDASKIRIVDGEYLYFLWDKSGITAYREPQGTGDNYKFGNDYAKFNKYGLSLVENGKIRLRSGYEYKEKGDSRSGNITNEVDKIDKQNIGFYLYDNKGYKVFSTEVENDDVTNASARLTLTGEMYADATLNTSTTTFYDYSSRYIISSVNSYYNTQTQVEEPQNVEQLSSEKKWVFVRDSGKYYHVYIFTKDSRYYTKILEQWYIVVLNNSTLYIQTDYDPEWHYTSSTNFNRVSISIIDPNTNIATTRQLYKDSATPTYYYLSRATIEPGQTKEQIGVYYNHRAINQPAQDGDYCTRLLTCVKYVSGNKLNNIFSVLSDGSLYIGGTITPKNSNQSTISNLDSYVKIDEDKGIKMSPDGEITIAGIDIQEETNRRIEEIAATARNAGLIQHNHQIPALEIAYDIEDVPVSIDSQPEASKARITSAGHLDLSKAIVRIYNTDNDDDEHGFTRDPIHYIKLSDLLDAQFWETKAGATEYTGTAGGNSTYNGSYYTQSGIVNVAYQVVQGFYNKTIAVGTGYDQGNWVSFVANGNNINSRCDCSGFVSAVWQALGDWDYGNAPNTYSMLAGTYPSNWRMMDYDYSILQPGDVVLAQEHVAMIAEKRNGIWYSYDFGDTSNLIDSYNNTYQFYDFTCLKIIRRIQDIPVLENTIPIDRTVYNVTAGNDNKNAINFYFTGNMSESFCGPYPSSVEVLNSTACRGLRRIIQSCKGEYGGWPFAAASYAKLYRATILGNTWINSGSNGAKTLENWLANVYANRPGWMGTANTGNETYGATDLPLAQAIYNNLRYPNIYGAELHTGSENFRRAIIKAVNGVPLYNGWVGHTWAAPPCFAVLFNLTTDQDEGTSGQPRGGVYLMYRSASGSIDMFNENVI